MTISRLGHTGDFYRPTLKRTNVPQCGWTPRSRRYLVERGDTGLGRDAYGPPRRERDRRGYGPGPHPSVDGSPPSEYEEDDAVASGRPVDAEEDDYGQLLSRPGETPPHPPRLRQPGRPHPGQPGRFPPGGGPPNNGPPSAGPGHGGMPGSAMPGSVMPGSVMPHGPVPHTGPPNTGPPNTGPPNGVPPPGGVPHGGVPHGGPPNSGPVPGRQSRLPNGRRVPPG